MRENAQILLHRYKRRHRQRFLVHLATAFLMVDSHHIAIACAMLVALNATIGTALGDNASAKVWSRFDFDLGRIGQAFGGVRKD